MKIVCVSDLHGLLPAIPSCDMLLVAGDICRDVLPEIQFNYIKNEFNDWCKQAQCPVFVIAGNHDFVFELVPRNEFDDCEFYYLQDSFVTYNGINIYGSPWSLKFGDYSFMCGEKRMKMIVDCMPKNIDILLTHGPPYGIMDGAPRFKQKGLKEPEWEHTGSKDLLKKVLEIKPKIHVFGHIHEGYGKRHWVDEDGEIYFINASHRNGDFTGVQNPIVVNL